MFKWFLNGDLLSDTGPELKLMNIFLHHSGNYSCQAFNNRTMRNQTSESVTVSVLKCKLKLNDLLLLRPKIVSTEHQLSAFCISNVSLKVRHCRGF